MPTNLYCKASFNISLKKYRLLAIFLLSPLFFFGQTLTGLWTGALSNDSNTVRKDQSFEIALTEYKGKVYGYSRSEFIVDDTLYYVVKRVKGTIEGDVCEVTDDEIVAYNFRGKLDKGVKVVSTFRRNQNDSTWYLDGTWKTNATKKYYAVSGKVNLAEEKDLTASKLFPHLEELKLADDIAFYKDRKEGPSIVKVAKPEKIKTEYSTKEPVPSTNVTAVVATPTLERVDAKPVPEEALVSVQKTGDGLSRTDTKKIDAAINLTPSASTKSKAENAVPEEEMVSVKKPVGDLAKTDTKNVSGNAVNLSPSVTDKKIVENKIPVTTNNNPPTKQDPVNVKNNSAKPNQTTAATNTVAKTNAPVKQAPAVVNNPVVEKKETKTEPVVAVVEKPKEEKPIADIIAKTSVVAGRKSEFSQVVSFRSDSLELSLYDNGEVDGDTVSVFMNGEVILSKQGLRSSAIKKTIYITPGNEDFTLVLFAENLGKYPPNTGLLVVHDGDDVYNLRFSSDYQKNAGIVFRRKQ